MKFENFLEQHPKLTRSLKKFILEQETKISKVDFENFLTILHDALLEAQNKLRSVPAGSSRARKLHQLVDQEIERENQIEASCKKGCSACCYIEVEITSYEAEILEKLINEGLLIDRQQLLLQSSREVGDLLWKKSSHFTKNQCVFLNKFGDCRIYEERPVMCRRHSVTSPAHLCATLDAAITLRYFPMVDVLISAANEDLELQVGPLAKMLQQKLL